MICCRILLVTTDNARSFKPVMRSSSHMRGLMGRLWLAGRVCYWDLVEETMLESFQAHKSYVCSLAMHPDGTLLLTSSTDGTVKVWQ